MFDVDLPVQLCDFRPGVSIQLDTETNSFQQETEEIISKYEINCLSVEARNYAPTEVGIKTLAVTGATFVTVLRIVLLSSM